MKRNQAFTLIELLVVISIIALLSSVILASLNGAREKGRIASIELFVGNINHLIGANMVGGWNFNDCTTGTAMDLSGNGDDIPITYASACDTSDTYSGSGQSYVVTGNHGLVVPASKSLDMGNSSFTLSAWIKINATFEAENMIIEHNVWGGNNDVYQLDLTGGGIRFNWPTFNLTTLGLNYTVNLNDGLWHQIVGVYDQENGKMASLYLDGKLVKSMVANGSVSPSTNGAHYTYIGSRGNTTYFFPGKIDDVYIYKSALTAMNVSHLYAEQKQLHEDVAVK